MFTRANKATSESKAVANWKVSLQIKAFETDIKWEILRDMTRGGGAVAAVAPSTMGSRYGMMSLIYNQMHLLCFPSELIRHD
jgi:hypothetical protein